MDELDDLLEALTSYQQAQKDLEECQERVGYEAGYYCRWEQESVEKAKKKVNDTLTRIIDKRIQRVIVTAQEGG